MTHDTELEMQLLGGLLGRSEKMALIENLRPSMFYDARHQIVFKVMRELYKQLQVFDITTVSSKLREDGSLDKIGGDPFIAGLLVYSSQGSYVDVYANDIIRYYGLRRLDQIGEELRNTITVETDPESIASDYIDKLSKVQVGVSGDEIVGSDDLSTQTYGNIGVKRRYINTGLSSLDRFTGGVEPATFTIIAARTRVGKSDLMLNMTLNMSKSKRVGIISLEMKDRALMRRMQANMAGVNRLDIRTGNLQSNEMDELAKATIEIGKRPIFITDKSGMTATQVASKINLMQKKYGVDIVFIDHLHRIRFKNDTRKTHDSRREVAEILADASRGYDIPIVCLAQLNRENAKENKRPSIENIRDAGEDDADVILMLWREKAYEYPTEDDLEILIGKDRDGSSGIVHCKYDLTTGRIRQYTNNDKSTGELEPDDREPAPVVKEPTADF